MIASARRVLKTRSMRAWGVSAIILVLVGAATAYAQGDSESGTCVPECRSGYLCISGACVSACDPACGEDEMCVGRSSELISEGGTYYANESENGAKALGTVSVGAFF